MSTETGFVGEVHEGLEAVLPLEGIDIELPLAEIYGGLASWRQGIPVTRCRFNLPPFAMFRTPRAVFPLAFPRGAARFHLITPFVCSTKTAV